MSTYQGNIKDEDGNKVIPNTTAAAVYDAAKNQALSQTLVNTPDKAALGYPAFSTVVDYTAGQVVYHLNKLWKFKVNHSAGAWNASHVDETNMKDLAGEVYDMATEANVRAIVSGYTPSNS